MYPGAHADRHPDKPAIIMAERGEVTTFAAFEAMANRIAHWFRRSDLRRGDHVAFIMGNSVELLACESAAERSGLYYTPISYHLSSDEVAYVVADCQARVVVMSDDLDHLDQLADELPARCPNVQHWVVAGLRVPTPDFQRLEDLTADLPAVAIDDERLGAPMLYSSGTSGRPKGIFRSVPDVPPSASVSRVEFARRMFCLREGMVYLSPAPLYHSAPQASVATALRLGATSVIMERFDAAGYLKAIEDYRVTHSQVVPTMFSRLLQLPKEVREAADLSSLECIVHAAAPCPVTVKERIIGWVGPIINEYYSSSEANGATFCDSKEWLARKGTVGRSILGEILVLDDDGKQCPPGVDGTIWFKGATMFEYFNDPAQTAANRSADGTTSTVGDVGHVDEDGYLFLTDRKTMMIISGGVNIYPQEVENVIVTHEAVFDVAVIGVPNEDFGEEVKAVVQLAPGALPTPEQAAEIIAFCRSQLAHVKCPRTVDFVEELPRLPTGKLLKRLVRDSYWQGRTSAIV
jgi:long-chain acyl-CoA synthetase